MILGLTLKREGITISNSLFVRQVRFSYLYLRLLSLSLTVESAWPRPSCKHHLFGMRKAGTAMIIRVLVVTGLPARREEI